MFYWCRSEYFDDITIKNRVFQPHKNMIWNTSKQRDLRSRIKNHAATCIRYAFTYLHNELLFRRWRAYAKSEEDSRRVLQSVQDRARATSKRFVLYRFNCCYWYTNCHCWRCCCCFTAIIFNTIINDIFIFISVIYLSVTISLLLILLLSLLLL